MEMEKSRTRKSSFRNRFPNQTLYRQITGDVIYVYWSLQSFAKSMALGRLGLALHGHHLTRTRRTLNRPGLSLAEFTYDPLSITRLLLLFRIRTSVSQVDSLHAVNRCLFLAHTRKYHIYTHLHASPRRLFSLKIVPVLGT